MLSEGRRIRPQTEAPDSWIAQPSWNPNNRALYMEGTRPQPAKVQALPRWQEAEPGTWGIAVLVRPDLAIESTTVLPLRPLRADRVRRAALVVDLRVEGRPLSVVGTHMPHLPYGSHRTWAELRRLLRTRGPPRRGALGRHEHVGPARPLLHAGLAPQPCAGRTWPAW